ncbi:MAG: pilus assembly protein PilM [Pirellulaceae bacterium]
MAKNSAVWGIDIGRCALKALRCRLDGDAVVADGFDYIEYPKLLTQSDADAPQLVKEALEQFLSRNDVKGDKVAISVSGESGLARYFKPPPVDVKKIADIVKYEAKQQIPFALEDVIWDYQRMAGGQEVDGFALDTEIGLFAMKREQVQKSLLPYNRASIEVDFIQLAPIAIYNYVSYDITQNLPEGEEYNSEAPPASIVVLSIGTDTTDLVVTNGYRVWQRNIPLGGNHFTKQLSKDLKLTFAKAEHLKRNPKQAEDPKAVFQAMRPIFADLVTEVQRSIGFFQSLDRKAKIESVVMLGNTVRLPGLVQYLSKHLGYEIREVESFKRLSGATVVASPAFKDNLLAFGGCYGLCLQALAKGKLATNLLPRELLTIRMIRAKKPWAIAAVGALVLACALNYVGYSLNLNEVHESQAEGGTTWKAAVEKAKSVTQVSSNQISADKAKLDQLELIKKIGQEVVGSSDRRVLWLEIMRAINVSLPAMDEKLQLPPGVVPDVSKLPFTQRKDLKIEYIETQFYPDLKLWFNDQVKTNWLLINPDAAQAAAGAEGAAPATTPPPAAPVAAAGSAEGSSSDYSGYDSAMGGGGGAAARGPSTDVSGINITGPSGPGWVVEIKGHHFFNEDRRNAGGEHVRKTLLFQLEHGQVELPLGPNQGSALFSMKELGIAYPILSFNPRIQQKFPIPNPNYVPPVAGAATFGSSGAEGPGLSTAQPLIDPANPPYFVVPKYDFRVQFCWVETPLNLRIENRKKAVDEAQKAAAAAAGTGAVAAPPAAPAPASLGMPAVAPGTTPQVAPEMQPLPTDPAEPGAAAASPGVSAVAPGPPTAATDAPATTPTVPAPAGPGAAPPAVPGGANPPAAAPAIPAVPEAAAAPATPTAPPAIPELPM